MVLKPDPSEDARPGVIEVKIREIAQLFNTLDPTPFPEKDLDRDAEEFIVGWASELPHDVPIELHIYLTRPAADPGIGPRITETVHAFFTYRAKVTQRRLRALVNRGRWSLGIGLVFLGACVVASDLMRNLGSSPLYDIGAESLVIGGWVAMWRPMEIFLYDWWPLRGERRVYERLADAEVVVSESLDAANPPHEAR